MTPEILPIDDAAALALMGTLRAMAAQPQTALLERVAQLFATHRTTHTPGPLGRKLEDAYTALMVSGYHDDELMARLRTAKDSARNLGKERAA